MLYFRTQLFNNESLINNQSSYPVELDEFIVGSNIFYTYRFSLAVVFRVREFVFRMMEPQTNKKWRKSDTDTSARSPLLRRDGETAADLGSWIVRGSAVDHYYSPV